MTPTALSLAPPSKILASAKAPAAPSGVAEDFKSSLVSVEQQLRQLSDDLIAGDAVAFAAHCAPLPELIAAFSNRYQALPKMLADHPTLQRRLRELSTNLSMQRENMARRANGVARALQVLLPANEKPTYGKMAGSFGQERGSASFTSVRA